MEWRRFELIDGKKEKALLALLDQKSITRQDLILILSTLRLKPHSCFSPAINEYLASMVHKKQLAEIKRMMAGNSFVKTIVIKGPSGPTGKSTLAEVLQRLGLPASTEEFNLTIELPSFLEKGQMIPNFADHLFEDGTLR